MTRLASLFQIAPRRRLLPLFIAVAAIALIIKAGSFASDLTRFVNTAGAQEQAGEETGAPSQGESGESGADGSSGADAGSGGGTGGGEASAGSPAADAARSNLGGISASERKLLEDLKQRRAELQEREREAELREQILASTEQRIDEKIEKLKKLEKRIQQLVEKHKTREDKQLESIVSVYETMKPKDAAPVFERLKLPIQMQVATRMKDRNMAALLAEMNPDAAQRLTARLATRDELPEAAELLDKEGDGSAEGS